MKPCVKDLQKHSYRGVLLKKCFQKFHKSHRKTPVSESLFNKVPGLRPATLFKKRIWHRCFTVNFVKFLRTPFFIEHLWWRLLIILFNLKMPEIFFLVDFEQVFYKIFFVWKSLFHFVVVVHETFLQETMQLPKKNEGQQLFWKYTEN